MLDDYAAALAGAPIAPESRRTYLSKVRQYLAWLVGAAVDGDPLTTPAARDWAVRDYRTHLRRLWAGSGREDPDAADLLPDRG